METERKFLVTEVPNGLLDKNLVNNRLIKQFYLAFNPMEIRVRCSYPSCKYTMQAKHPKKALTRFESPEIFLGVENDGKFDNDGKFVHELRKCPYVYKYRTDIQHSKNIVLSLDHIYEASGYELDFWIAEFEGPEKSIKNLKPPKWCGKEVTGKSKWYNASIAKQHFKPKNKLLTAAEDRTKYGHSISCSGNPTGVSYKRGECSCGHSNLVKAIEYIYNGAL